MFYRNAIVLKWIESPPRAGILKTMAMIHRKYVQTALTFSFVFIVGFSTQNNVMNVVGCLVIIYRREIARRRLKWANVLLRPHLMTVNERPLRPLFCRIRIPTWRWTIIARGHTPPPRACVTNWPAKLCPVWTTIATSFRSKPDIDQL